jgi:hypothetical protein
MSNVSNLKQKSSSSNLRHSVVAACVPEMLPQVSTLLLGFLIVQQTPLDEKKLCHSLQNGCFPEDVTVITKGKIFKIFFFS